MYKVRLGHKELQYPKIKPDLVRSIRRLGYEPMTSDSIHYRLEEAVRKAGPAAIVCAAGISILADGCSGLWPTRAFAEAFARFRSDRFVPEIPYSREERIALAITMPAYKDAISPANVQDCYPNGRYTAGCGDSLGCAALTGSYLQSPRLVKPADMLIRLLYVALRMEHRNHMQKGAVKPQPLEYALGDLGEREVLADQARIGWNVMPDSAWRLSVELFGEKECEGIYKVARTLAVLVGSGYHVSAKFTGSDIKPPGSSGTRLVMYVPTAALMPTLLAAKHCGLFDGGLDGRGDLSLLQHAHTGIMFPDSVSLLTSAEGGGSSIAQGLEALDAVKRLGIIHHALASNQYGSDPEGSNVDLGSGNVIHLFPPAK